MLDNGSSSPQFNLPRAEPIMSCILQLHYEFSIWYMGWLYLVWWGEYLNGIQKVGFELWLPYSAVLLLHFRGGIEHWVWLWLGSTSSFSPFVWFDVLNDKEDLFPRTFRDAGWMNIELIPVHMWAMPLNTFVTLNNLLGLFGLSFFLCDLGITG